MHGTFGGPSFKRAPPTKSATKKPPMPKKGAAVKAKSPTPTKGRKL